MATLNSAVSSIGNSPETISPAKLITNFTGVLRVVGALAVVASAVIYMLQGLEGADQALRNWVYVMVMAGLTIAGVGSHYFLKDNMGARLLFALAALLVPVQVTQLSAMLNLQLIGLSAADLVPWMTLLVISFSVAAAALYFCFNVVARPVARLLTATYLLLNSLLLAPWRDSFTTLLLMGLMGVIYWALQQSVFTKDRRFNLWEGVLVRLMVAAPMILLMVRYAFSVNQLLAWGLLLEAIAVYGWLLLYWLASPGWLRRIANAAATLFALAGNIFCAVAYALFNSPLPNEFLIYAVFLPSIAIVIVAAHMSDESGVYHLAASLGLVAMAALLPLFNVVHASLMSLVSLILLLLAGRIRSRALFCTALLCGIAQLAALVFAVLSDIQSVSWLMMAVLGVALVTLASFAERFGHRLAHRSRATFHAIEAWNL